MDNYHTELRRDAKLLLEGLSLEEARICGVEALRRWRKTQRPPTRTVEQLADPSANVFQVHADLGLRLVHVLAEHKNGQTIDANRVKEAFVDEAALATDWMSGFLEFMWWLERAGLAVPLTRGASGHPTQMRLTARGVRWIDDPNPDDNPLLPGFLDRIKARCPNLPAGVIALLVDARACLDVSLLRSAVVMMGVAYELAVEEVIRVLLTKVTPSLLAANTLDAQAAIRLRNVRTFIAGPGHEVLIPDREQRRHITAAYDFAELLRQRRNDAAHTRPAFDFAHKGETEEFLVSAGRHLPALWSLGL